MGYVSLTTYVLIYHYPNYKATESLNNSYRVHTFESVVTVLYSIPSQAQKVVKIFKIFFLN